MGWTPESRSWLSGPSVRGRTVMAGYALAEAVAAGRLDYLPVRLSGVPRLLAGLRPDLAVVTGVRRGRTWSTGHGGFGPAAARPPGPWWWRSTRRALISVGRRSRATSWQQSSARTLTGRPLLPGAPTRSTSPWAEMCESVLPEDPTLQFGPGGIGEGVVAALDRPVRIWSGLVTEAVADLDRRGPATRPHHRGLCVGRRRHRSRGPGGQAPPPTRRGNPRRWRCRPYRSVRRL